MSKSDASPTVDQRKAGIKELERRYGLDEEKIQAEFRMYRAWPPRRFSSLIAHRRPDGSVLFSFTILQDLKTERLTPAQRRRLEEKLIRTEMDRHEFIALVRKAKEGDPVASPRIPRKKPSAAIRRACKALRGAIAQCDSLARSVELLVEQPSSLPKNEVGNVRAEMRALPSLLRTLRDRANIALRRLREKDVD